MGISFKVALENKLISQDTLKVIPKKCIYGFDLEFNDSMRNIECSLSNCKCRLVDRIAIMLKELEVSAPREDIKKIVDGLNLISVYQMFAVDESMVQSKHVQSITNIVKALKKIIDTEISLDKVLRFSGDRTLMKASKALIDGYRSIEEFYTDVEIGRLSFINERLGIATSESCALSLDILNKLLGMKEELIFAESLFRVREEQCERLMIAFNDNANPYINKGEAVDVLSKRFNKKFVLVNSITDRVDILVKNYMEPTAKFRSARMINDRAVADKVNSGELDLSKADTFIENELKPVGNKIYIASMEDIQKRLELV